MFINSTPKPSPTIKRCWKNYDSRILNDELKICKFDLGIEDVQGFWNAFENEIIRVVDKVIPYTEFINNCTSATYTNNIVKPKINKKRRLIRQLKNS